MSRWSANGGVMQKAIPENPKYKNVRPRVDSGATIRKYIERIQEAQRNIKQRNDEIFKRIKITSLVKLMIEVFNETSLQQCNIPALPAIKQDLLSKSYAKGNEESKQTAAAPVETVKDNSKSVNVINGNTPSRNARKHSDFGICSLPRAASMTSISTRSTLHSIITGIGEMDIGLVGSKAASETRQSTVKEPYLLLDVRDADSYQQCHITTAKSYPYSMLIRTCNYETKDMLACKNKKDKIIVLYDEDESVAPRVATTLVQRGYNNIFMLSGGLRLAFYRFPEGLLQGTPPISCLQECSSAKNYSTMLKLQQKSGSQFTSKNCFTMDNIQALREYLEKCLALEDASLDHRSAQVLMRKSCHHRPLKPHSTKGRTIPWK